MALSPEKMAEMTDLAKEVTELVHRVAARRLVQAMEHIHDTEIAPIRNALKRILAEPYGCPMCDSGKLRNAAKEHWESCGYAMAFKVLE